MVTVSGLSLPPAAEPPLRLLVDAPPVSGESARVRPSEIQVLSLWMGRQLGRAGPGRAGAGWPIHDGAVGGVDVLRARTACGRLRT